MREVCKCDDVCVQCACGALTSIGPVRFFSDSMILSQTVRKQRLLRPDFRTET